MLISRQAFDAIDPNSEADRVKYSGAVIDEALAQKREFITDADFGGWHDRNMRPVVHFRWGANGWVKRSVLEPFCD